ncbi:O-methyltransferase [Angustibacter peucedani]
MPAPTGPDPALLRAVARRRRALVRHAEPWARLLHVEPRVASRGARALLRATSNPAQGRWLAHLAHAAAQRAGGGPVRVVELGTSAGVSAMYLLAGMSAAGGGHLTTFEGDEQVAALAQHQLDAFVAEHDLRTVVVDVRVGRFSHTVGPFLDRLVEPLDLVFVDGHHQEGPTLEYHRQLRARTAPRAVVVHDDIAWSPGMARAWAAIRAQEQVRVTELRQGGRPSRGVLWLGEPAAPDDPPQTHDLDAAPGRLLRRAARAMIHKQ